MDTLKKAIGWQRSAAPWWGWQRSAAPLWGWRRALAAAAVVLLAAGSFTLLAGEKPERGYLGVSVQSLDRDEKEKLGVSHGVEVTSVEKESAAAKAGVKEDDIIQLVNGEKIRDPRDLIDIIGELAPGTKVTIGLKRDGKAVELSAELGKREHDREFIWKGKKMPFFFRSSARLGVVLQELNADLASYFGVKPDDGALIIGVEKESPAEKAGLKSGDVVVQMGDKPVKDVVDVQKALAELKKGDSVVVTVVRHGKKQTLKAEPVFDHRHRSFRIFRGGKDAVFGELEKSDLEMDIPELDIQVPPLPELPPIDEVLERVHEKMDRVRVRLGKKLEKIHELSWI